jgi:hypothetical protein
MSPSTPPDYYETLQVSPRADQETIERVFRHLAKRLHPDNPDSGNTDLFNQLVEAYRTLSIPEQRASYDARYDQIRRERWRIFDQRTAGSNVIADLRIRSAILTVLYTARRNDTDRPGVGIVDLERMLGCPEEHMKFHVWYLKENGWIRREDDGTLAITVAGVDRVLEEAEAGAVATHLIGPGNQNGSLHQDIAAA